MWKKVIYNEYIISEWVVIINKRELSKENTRKKIVENTTTLLVLNGFTKVSTKEIAKASEVSQGTIFLHFLTKENLLNEILNSNIMEIENALKVSCVTSFSYDKFLRSYLDVLSEYEDILSRIYKDYPNLSDNLKRNVDSLDTLMKNLLLENMRNSQSKKLSIVDAFIVIDAFLSQIKVYLIEKEVYSSSNFIIRQRRGKITKLHKILFGDKK
jgi:AcrR family transcriptional regulator